MKRLFLYVCAATTVALVSVSSSVFALVQQNVLETAPLRERKNATNEADAASLSETIRRVQRQTGGQILGAERVSFDGHSINRVKYMDENGHVRYVDVPDFRPPPKKSSGIPNDLSLRSDHH